MPVGPAPMTRMRPASFIPAIARHISLRPRTLLHTREIGEARRGDACPDRSGNRAHRRIILAHADKGARRRVDTRDRRIVRGVRALRGETFMVGPAGRGPRNRLRTPGRHVGAWRARFARAPRGPLRMDEQPSVSVVTSTFNRRRSLARLLDGLDE